MTEPIFIAWTRSFWLGIVPLLTTLPDIILQVLNPETIGPLSSMISDVFGISADQANAWLQIVSVVAGLIIAHQRRGASRPYSMNPRQLK